MKINFKEYFDGYKSIKDRFDMPEFKNFNVITGLNGSGKTHFLEAIRGGDITLAIDELKIETIQFFDYQNFKLKNEETINQNYYRDIVNRLWQQIEPEVTVIKNQYHDIFNIYNTPNAVDDILEKDFSFIDRKKKNLIS